MFIDIDYNKRPQNAKLHLAKPNKQIISIISEKFRDSVNTKLGNINELTFSIPFKIDDVHNEHVDMIKEKMLIRLTLGTYKEWYVVDEIEEDGDETDVFNVKAFSLGYELKSKRVTGLTSESINATQFLVEALRETAWSIGTVDPMFDIMFRSVDINDSNSLDAIMQGAETYGALLNFDDDSRKVSFLDIKKNGSFRGMTVNYGRFLRSIKRARTTDEMVTRLYIEGSEGLTIHSVNPTGMGYVEDFSYFMYPFERDVNKNTIASSYYMSDDLCHAIINHNEKVSLNAPTIQQYISDKLEKENELALRESELNELELELNNILQLLDVAQATEDEALIAQRKSERDAKQISISSKNAEIASLNTDIANIQANIDTLQSEISKDNNFTIELLNELNLYIIESKWLDDRYIDAQELYDDGLKKFEELRQPKVVIDVTIDNLLDIVEEQYYWDKLVIGDLIKVKYPQMNIEYMAKIIEINYDLENKEASLVIANTKDLINETEKLVQLLYGSTSATTLIENNKYRWDKINYIEQEVGQIISQEWNANKNKIIAGVNNSVEVGNRGVIIRNPDIPNEIVIMQAGIIALSMDGGETWKTAIKPDGIVAERLIGRIIAGQELLITNSSGSFTFDVNGVQIDADSFIIRSSSGLEQINLLDVWNSTTNFVDALKDDSIITAYEKKMLKTQWDKIADRYNANSTKLDNYYTDAGASLLFVQDYRNKYTALYDYLFVELQGDKPLLDPLNMSNSTSINVSTFDTRFKEYDSAEVELEKQLSIRAKSLADQALTNAETAQSRIDEVENDIVYSTRLYSTNGDKFTNGNIDTTVYVKVFRGVEDITLTLPASSFVWRKTSADGTNDTAWANAHVGVGHTIQITKSDVDKKATFWCDIDIPTT